MIRKQKLIQAFGELLIPLVGFFFLDWNLYFILLFLFIDLLVTEVFLNFKAAKIHNYSPGVNPKKKWYFLAGFSALLSFLLIVLSHIAVKYISGEANFQEQFVEFLMYEEMGIPIPQGVILLPLVALGNYQQYKMFFLMPARYRTEHISGVIGSRIQALVIGLSGAFLAIILGVLTDLPEVVYLILMLGAKFWIDFRHR